MNYIIDFKDHITSEEIDQFFQDNSITKLKEYSAFEKVYLVSSAEPINVTEIIESIVQDDAEGIQLLDTDVIFTHNSANQDTFEIAPEQNWWKTVVWDEIDFDQVQHTFTRYGENAVVYILDSGLDTTHPEMSNVSVDLLYSHTDNFTDSNGHGTAIASIIAGNTCGLVGSTLKIVKIFDAAQPTLLSEMLSALDTVATDYINNNGKPSVMNCSWGVPYNQYINEKIQQLIDMGIFVVAAAGNSGMPISDVTPACIPDVLTIGSFGQDLTPSNFSNYTDPSFISFTANETNLGALDGWAPGEKIWAAAPGGGRGYTAGTSMSAAIASGAVAYNIDRYVDANGYTYTTFSNYHNYQVALESTAEFINNTAHDYNSIYRGLCLGKSNILDLSDPKYSNSDNLIVSYRNKGVRVQSDKTLINFRAGTTGYSHVYFYPNIEKITLKEQLPEYLSFESNGLLKYIAPIINENYIITNTPLTIHYKDGSTFDQTLVCVVFNEELNYSNMNTVLPEDDVLRLMLSSTCVTTGYCGFDDCFYFVYGSYCFGGTKGYGCVCTSDMDLKENIRLIDRIAGINLYSFEYKNNTGKTYRGAMAQELLDTKFSSAVQVKNGYYAVNYCVLPTEFLKHCELPENVIR
jgi:subtilisin family serine protease